MLLIDWDKASKPEFGAISGMQGISIRALYSGDKGFLFHTVAPFFVPTLHTALHW